MNEARELAQVMDEITEAMGAVATVLTIHPAYAPARVVHAEPHAGLDAATVAAVLERAEIWSHDQDPHAHQWRSCTLADGRCLGALSMPVAQVEGHSPLIITSFFEDTGGATRARAEEVYLRRRPFAVGYFRLWQSERTRTQRIEALESALDLSGFGVLLLDRSSAITFANQAATGILARRDGLDAVHGAVDAIDISDSMGLQVAIEHVLAANEAGTPLRKAPLLRIHRRAKLPLIVSVLPTRQPAVEPGDVAGILFILDPLLDQKRLIEPICDLYGFTGVETTLVVQLLGGLRLAEAAAGMKVKEQAARNALRQVFAKTGTRSQVELVRILLSSVLRTSSLVALVPHGNGTEIADL